MRPVVVGDAGVEAAIRMLSGQLFGLFLKSVLEKVGDLFGCSEIISYLCTRKKGQVSSSCKRHASLAQLVEQLTLNQWV